MIKTAFPESEGFGLEDIVEDLAKEYIDQAAENGRQKGRREGRQEGRQEGRFSILFLQLCYKLGTAKLPANLKSQMAALSPEQLDQLGEDLFDFSTIADLRRWLAELP